MGFRETETQESFADTEQGKSKPEAWMTSVGIKTGVGTSSHWADLPEGCLVGTPPDGDVGTEATDLPGPRQ